MGLSEYRYKNIRTTHSTSSEVRKQVGEERWNSYFKFTTYRDPYKRFFSSCNFPRHHKLNKINCYQELVEHIQLTKSGKLKCEFCQQQELFTDGMDFLIRLDHIQEDFDTVCDKLGVQTKKIYMSNTMENEVYTDVQVRPLY